MKRKHRKSLLWRRFGWVIRVIIKFGELLLWISPGIINVLRNYIKHSKECFIRTLQSWLKKILGLCLLFQPISQCLDMWWNTLPCVWYTLFFLWSNLLLLLFSGHIQGFKSTNCSQKSIQWKSPELVETNKHSNQLHQVTHSWRFGA